jgi:hypothetical protein|eukprot:COSAG02_NODE_2137_length_9694_cov_51.871287_2_plen_151_part_00
MHGVWTPVNLHSKIPTVVFAQIADDSSMADSGPLESASSIAKRRSESPLDRTAYMAGAASYRWRLPWPPWSPPPHRPASSMPASGSLHLGSSQAPPPAHPAFLGVSNLSNPGIKNSNVGELCLSPVASYRPSRYSTRGDPSTSLATKRSG